MGGLNASFKGSNYSGMTRVSTVAEYWGIVDGSNNLIDMSGENLLTDRTEFDSWGESGTCAVTADQYRNPVDGTLNADLLDNTGGGLNDYRTNNTAALGALGNRTFTFSIWVRADAPHDCTIQLAESVGWTSTSINVPATNTWRRFSVTHSISSGVGAGAIYVYIYPGESWIATGQAYFSGASLIENNEFRTNRGTFLNPSDQSITKPAHDLADTNDPTTAYTDLQSSDGNRLPAREYDATGPSYYSKAHDDSLSVWDENFTFEMYFKVPPMAVSMNMFDHGTFNAGGMYMYMAATGYIRARLCKTTGGAGTVNIDTLTGYDDGHWHFYSLTREDNEAVVCVDGVCQAPVDVTGYGEDLSTTFYVGGNPANSLTGEIGYLAIHAEALSIDELAADRERILAIATNWSRDNQWSFERSTVATKQFSAGGANTLTPTLVEVPANVPRIAGPGGGVLIEGQDTQLHGFTEAFDSWTNIGVVVTADDHITPNGTVTGDLLDNTGGVNTDYSFITTANLGDLTGRTFISSVWIRADIPHVCTIRIIEQGIASGNEHYNVTTEWQRFTVSRTCAGAGVGTISTYVLPGEISVATGIAHFWGANLTETGFPVLYIPNPGAATSQVTRTADDLSIQVHPDATNEIILADTYCQNCVADDLTIYGEWKAEWSSSTDIGEDRILINLGNTTSANNDIELYVSSAGNVFLRFQDNGGTLRTINSAANPVDFSNWFSVRAFIDFTDLSRSELYINEVIDHAADSNMTGGATFDTDGNFIRPGANRVGTVSGCHWTRNLRINNREITV